MTGWTLNVKATNQLSHVDQMDIRQLNESDVVWSMNRLNNDQAVIEKGLFDESTPIVLEAMEIALARSINLVKVKYNPC